MNLRVITFKLLVIVMCEFPEKQVIFTVLLFLEVHYFGH